MKSAAAVKLLNIFKGRADPAMNEGKLTAAAPSAGWLGVRATLELKPPGAAIIANPIGTVWLPEERSAKTWEKFER